MALSSSTTKANAHDTQSALKTIDSLRVGKKRRRLKRLGADKGYDSIPFRRQLRKRKIKTAIRHREFKNRRNDPRMWNDAKENRYSPHRWKIEQRIACLDQNRRLDFLYERTRETYECFLTLARIRSYLKILARSRNRSF